MTAIEPALVGFFLIILVRKSISSISATGFRTLDDLCGGALGFRLLGGHLFGRRQDLLTVGLGCDGDAALQRLHLQLKCDENLIETNTSQRSI